MSSLSRSAGVQVVVRLRPLNEREKKHGTLPVVSASTNDKTVTVIKGTGSRQARSVFAFDDVFTAFSTQEEVFETTLKPVINDVLTGYCSCVCAYGQTGTGKTHTMEGSLDHPDAYGVIPRAAEAIFEQLNREELNYESYRVYCSFLEIYNEELCDLLDESDSNSLKSSPRKAAPNNNSLAIMEGKNGPFCRGLSEREVHNAADLLQLMRIAQQERKVGETSMNKQSSRSHCIFTLKVHAKRRLEDGALFETQGNLHMVDLAGSECAKTANLDDGCSNQKARDRERMNINQSLLTLGRVVQLLKEQSVKGDKAGSIRIPYRDSKLTRILQRALGGNSKTVIIATLSPSVTAIEESISTLNYAQTAHGIINKPVSTSYISQSTNASAILSGKDAPGSGQVGSIEKWTEMETRLEYMQCQVEEAKAALARKHLQQQELADRAAESEAEKIKYEEELQEVTIKNASLQEDLAQTSEQLQRTEKELSETKAQLEKTTLVLQATQKTEASLTKEATALIEALTQSVADGDLLHRMVLASRDADLERRRAAMHFNGSVASLLSDVKDALVALTEQESICQDKTNQLAAAAANKEILFLEKAKEVICSSVEKVDGAVASLKASIHEEGGIVPTAGSLARDTCTRVCNARSTLETSEQELTTQLTSTREELTKLGSQLSELENAHRASSEKALSVLEETIAEGRQKTQELVSSTCSALETAREDRRKIRDVTKETVEQWKLSMINSGDVISKQSATQNGSVEQTLEMLNSEMQRHANIEAQLGSQDALLRNSHNTSVAKHDAQKQLLLQTQTKMEESHNQQTQLLSSFVQNLMQGVEKLVQNQVSEVMKEVNQGHSNFLENNKSLVENHASITSSTLETLLEAKSLTSSIHQEAEVAKMNDETILKHLDETKSVFAEIQNVAQEHNANVNNFAVKTSQHLHELEDLEVEDTKIRQKLRSDGNECDGFLSGPFSEVTKEHVSALGDAGMEVATFARNKILKTTSSAINEMEKPRSEMMTSFMNECSRIEELMDKGMATIKERASDSSRIADELQGGVKSVAGDFTDRIAKERSSEVEDTKEAFLKHAKEHAEMASENIRRSQAGSQKTVWTTDYFVKSDLSAYEEVEGAPERASITYSDQLSSTPSENDILVSIRKLGKVDVSTVLQALSPNQDKKVRKSHKVPVGHMMQNHSHERNEPRSEHLS